MPADNKNEILSVVDIFGDKNIENGASRDLAHSGGLSLWHFSIRCIVLLGNKEKPTLLMQKRSTKKDHNGGLFDWAIAGHIGNKDNILETLYREALEEIGTRKKDLKNITFAGEELKVEKQITKKGEFYDQELVQTFFATCNQNLIFFEQDQDEVDSLWELSLEDFKRIINGETVTIKGIKDKKDITEEVNLEKFAPRRSNFYQKMLIMAERYSKGETIAV